MRRAKALALVGDIMPLWSPDMGEVMAVGMGFVFCGMCSGGGGMCAGLDWPFWPFSKPGAPALGWGGGGSWLEVGGGPFSAILSEMRFRGVAMWC